MPSACAASSASAISTASASSVSLSSGVAGDHVLERRAVKKLHRDEGFSAFFANVVDGADVGMVEGGGGLRFALKARQRLGIAGDFIRQKLERDKAMEAGVFCLKDHSHPTAAELFNDAIMGDALADHVRGVRGDILVGGVGGVNGEAGSGAHRKKWATP